MRYKSTRGGSPDVSFEGAVLNGLAPDGGLYVPEIWPQISENAIKSFQTQPYEDIVFQIVRHFVGDTISADDLHRITFDAYDKFDSLERAPLTNIGSNRWLLELFHGPTYAFKDFALQLVARLQDYFLKRRGAKITILTATSGDTGAAAIEACRGLDTVEIFVLHPKDKISLVQRKQMTTVRDENVHNIAVEGTFDDCQALVKGVLSDREFVDQHNLSTLNSINWGRIVGQIAYYFSSASKLGAPGVTPIYSVPTGNFGDVYSGYAASRMGLGIDRLIVATNNNDILHRFFEEGGVYKREDVQLTSTPCMDIQSPSNFERVIFDLFGADSALVREKMDEFTIRHQFEVSESVLARARKIFSSEKVSEPETDATIKVVYEKLGRIVDPHTAVGIRAAEKCARIRNNSSPIICLATAHPAKFPDHLNLVLRNVCLDTPVGLKNVMDLQRKESFDTLPVNVKELTMFVRSRSMSRTSVSRRASVG